MIERVALDTGPLIAVLDKDEQYHDWCQEQFKQINQPLLCCEAVITEACYLLRALPNALSQIEDYLERGLIVLDFALGRKTKPVFTMMRKYADVPMSLADACLVAIAEGHPGCRVFTLDSDFRIYRFWSRRLIPLLIPD